MTDIAFIITEDDLNETVALVCSEPGDEIDEEKRSKMGDIVRRVRSQKVNKILKTNNLEIPDSPIINCQRRNVCTSDRKAEENDRPRPCYWYLKDEENDAQMRTQDAGEP
jgi:hypothetical protein